MLTDKQIRALAAGDKAIKVADAGGLHLLVSTAGTKLWRYRYQMAGKEKLLAIGQYPEISLAAAREARDEAKALVKKGRDPSIEKRLRRAASVASGEETFEILAREWHESVKYGWTAKHAADVLDSLERFVFPTLGPLPYREITPPMVLAVLRAIERRPAIETAHRVRQRISAVFVYGIATGKCEQDPAAIVRTALKPVKKGRQPAITDLTKLRVMLREAEAISAHPVTRIGLRFLALTAVRPSEVRGAMQGEFRDLHGADPTWEIPAARMKMREEHWAPLSRQAVEAIDAVLMLTRRMPLIFPSTRHAHQPMSENALGYLLNRAGYHHKHVPHGFRASFSTIMNELYRADRAVIDLMLAHAPDNKVEAAYNRALYWPRRRELAQEWADMLLEGFPPASELLNLPRR